MPAVGPALLRLYPRAWRQRYGTEMQEVLESKRLTFRAIVDLIAGAIDARINPQWTPASRGAEPGVTKMVSTFRCAPAGVTSTDQWRSAAWMIGGCLVLTAISTLLQLQIGPNAFSEGLLYSAFPASLALSSECTYLKRYSPRARLVMSAGGAMLIILMIWAAVWVAYLI